MKSGIVFFKYLNGWSKFSITLEKGCPTNREFARASKAATSHNGISICHGDRPTLGVINRAILYLEKLKDENHS